MPAVDVTHTKIDFISISLDPSGVYVGCDARFNLWHYVPQLGMWIMFFAG